MSYAIASIAFATTVFAVAGVLGLALLSRFAGSPDPSAPPFWPLAIPLGLGVVVCLLFVLAAAGALRPVPVAAIVGVAASLAAGWLYRRRKPASSPRPVDPAAAVAAAMAALALVALGFSAPLEWDALAYHLPYARQYAEAGGLVLDERLRFPLHSHNFQLLYAVGLQFAAEPAAQLLHAGCGALSAIGLYVFARHHYGAAVAGLAVAVGTKYQGLVQLPVFALALAVAARGRGWRPALAAAATLAVFGSAWYLRNLLIAGDPLHPLGAPLFGFWLWDAGDLEGQMADVAGRSDHLPLELLPALAFPFLRAARGPVAASLAVVGLGGGLAWWLSSGYERYLLPSYPFLAVLSAVALVAAARRLAPRRWREAWARHAVGSAGVLRWLGAALLALALLATLARKWDEICFDRACVDRVYAEQLASHGARAATPGFADLRLYQLGLENEYYVLGRDVAGDWFGPYRYRDVLALADDPAGLAQHLRSLGRDSLLVHHARPPFDDFAARARLQPVFEEIYRDERVALYRLSDD